MRGNVLVKQEAKVMLSGAFPYCIYKETCLERETEPGFLIAVAAINSVTFQRNVTVMRGSPQIRERLPACVPVG